MSNKLCENLIGLMDRQNIGAVHLARMTGISLSTIKNIRKGSNTNPTIETLTPLAKYFNISLEEFIHGESFVNAQLKTDSRFAVNVPRKLPIITWSDVIDWPKNTTEAANIIYTERDCSEHAFALKFERGNAGDFSAPGIFLVDPALIPRHLDYVLVHKPQITQAFVKQYICDDEFTYLKSVTVADNLTVCDEKYRVIGVIVEYRHHIVSDDGKNTMDDFLRNKKATVVAC